MNCGCVSAWSHDCQLVYCLVTTRVAYITAGYWLQLALAATAATLSRFFPPEPLHDWHKMFWDHNVQWAINIISAKELDFHFSVLQSSTGYRHFGEGISHLTKVTSKTQQDVQQHLIAVIAGAVPPCIVLAMRSFGLSVSRTGS